MCYGADMCSSDPWWDPIGAVVSFPFDPRILTRECSSLAFLGRNLAVALLFFVQLLCEGDLLPFYYSFVVADLAICCFLQCYNFL